MKLAIAVFLAIGHAAQCAIVTHRQALRASNVTGAVRLAADTDAAAKPKTKFKKPLRGWDPWARDTSTKREEEGDWEPLKCGVTEKVGAHTPKDQACPDECPYFAQDLTDDEHCTYVCVTAEECPVRNPNRPVADTIETQFGDKRKICRAPYVQHCKVPDVSGPPYHDKCDECQAGYYLNSQGQCIYKFMVVIWALLVVLIVAVVFIVVWMVDLNMRPDQNEATVQHCLAFRTRQKLHQIEGEEKGRLWPLSTNLLRQVVAGPGMLLHFQFQFMVIVWALIIAALWYSFTIFIDEDLAVLGTRRFGTPRTNCILVAWGYETQQRLMWTKVLFLIIAYIISFIGCLLHAVRQLRIFQNEKQKPYAVTMNDFVARLDGLPRLKGDERYEEELKKAAISKYGKENIVGVSVCWDYLENEDDVVAAVEQRLHELETKRNPALLNESPDDGEPNFLRKGLLAVEDTLLGDDVSEAIAGMKDTLTAMESSEHAFIVFKSNKARNDAVEKEDGFTFRDKAVTVKKCFHQPDTTLWSSFGNTEYRAHRYALGVLKVFGGLVLWTVAFYLPYAWSVYTWNYDNGVQPGFVYGFAFSMVVVVGNAIMYQICSDVADDLRFTNRDDRECAYMIFYLVATSFNILVDMVSTYDLSYMITVGLNFRTYHGTKLEDVPTFTERFETYAIQRHLAESLYAYAWPSTFLIPFLIEPIVTIGLPLVFFKLIVSKNKKFKGRDAQACMISAPMDMGRYADILLDVVLGILIFYVPGGYTHWLFFFMAISHIYIYYFDHWKVLSNIPACTYASMNMDQAANYSLAPCIGLIVSCLVFKGNCQDYGYCVEGVPLVLACTGAWLLHTIVHVALLVYVVPMLGKKDLKNPAENKTYEEHDKAVGHNWFNANPIFCLRSRLIYEYKTPCEFYIPGNEHLLAINEDLGCHFKHTALESDGTEADSYDMVKVARSATKKLTGK